MGIKYCPHTRRQFLIGTGRSLMAVPLLPSLLPTSAAAAEPPRRLMMVRFNHGNCRDIWPDRSRASTNVGSIGVKEAMLSALGTATAISPVLSNGLYETIKNQLTIIRGFDFPQYGPIHGSQVLHAGSGRNNEGNYPTIDTVIEGSATVYPAGIPNMTRAVRLAWRQDDLGIRFFKKSGGVVSEVGPTTSPVDLYNRLFGALTGGTVPVTDTSNLLKSNIMNRVFSAYQSFKNSRKIAAEDFARLDEHMTMVSDLQTQYKNLGTTTTAPVCVKPAAPGGGYGAPLYSIFFDLLALAFKCDLTRYAVISLQDSLDGLVLPGCEVPAGRDMHMWAMHGPESQNGTIAGGGYMKRQYVQAWKGYYYNLVANRFLAPLNTMEGNTGRTYLDNMITAMTQIGEMEPSNSVSGHSGYDSQQVLIGSMGGRVRTGRYYALPESGGQRLPYNCYLITLMQLMGMPPSEYAYATPDGQGFGYYGYFGGNHPFRARFYNPVTEILT